MKGFIAGLLALFVASFANAADLQTSWDAVTLDDVGNPLGVPVDSYNVYLCGASTPLVSVPGTQLQHLEPSITTGNYCREVAAVVGAFEGARGQGSVILVAPGQTQNVNVQAIP